MSCIFIGEVFNTSPSHIAGRFCPIRPSLSSLSFALFAAPSSRTQVLQLQVTFLASSPFRIQTLSHGAFFVCAARQLISSKLLSPVKQTDLEMSITGSNVHLPVHLGLRCSFIHCPTPWFCYSRIRSVGPLPLHSDMASISLLWVL